MVADMFHYGHMYFIKQCKSLYKDVYLIIGIHSDEVCTNYKRTPIMTMEERVFSLKMFGLVDEVIPDFPLNPPKDFLLSRGVDMVVHAHPKNEDKFYRTLYRDADELGIFKRLDYTSSISTTDLINRIKERK
jgi:cytidyltransferase-like protein